MASEERLRLIAEFEGAYAKVDELLEGLGPEELSFAPSIQDAWSINDFLVHFLDADLSLCFRLRSAVAEPGRKVPVWDEIAWHDRLRYDAQDGWTCLALAKSLRSFEASSLRAIADSDWSGYRVVHEERGELSLESLLELYREHIVFHLPLIKRNLEALRARRA